MRLGVVQVLALPGTGREVRLCRLIGCGTMCELSWYVPTDEFLVLLNNGSKAMTQFYTSPTGKQYPIDADWDESQLGEFRVDWIEGEIIKVIDNIPDGESENPWDAGSEVSTFLIQQSQRPGINGFITGLLGNLMDEQFWNACGKSAEYKQIMGK